MAPNKGFSLDFSGFLDLAREIDDKYGQEALLNATVKAMDATRKHVNNMCGKALKESKYNFKEGEGYSQGNARKSLIEVSKMPVEVEGTSVKAYAGFNLNDAPEALILAMGTPHLSKDTKLYNAIKVKGRVKKDVEDIQKGVFEEALKNG